MGGFLDRPITDKTRHMIEGNGLKATVVHMQGWRSSMEDAHIAKASLDFYKDVSFFGVYDGHGGDFVAKYTEVHLLDLFTTNLKAVDLTDADAISSAFIKTYLDIDNDLGVQDEITRGDRSGCTAVSVFLNEQYIICANSGDSRAVLYTDGGVFELSHDHKPSNPDETKRIVDSGGCVVMKRVNGDLAVSRAFGDFGLKNNNSLPPEKQAVTALPDIEKKKRSPKDDFIVIACDGIWDVIDNQTLCEKINNELECEEDLSEIACNILDYCLAEGSKDNMSIIIVLLDPRQRTIKEKVEIRQKEKQAKKEREEYELAHAGNNISSNNLNDEQNSHQMEEEGDNIHGIVSEYMSKTDDNSKSK